MFNTVVLLWKCPDTPLASSVHESVPVASALGHQHLRSTLSGLLQVARAQTMISLRTSLSLDRLCGTVSLMLYVDQI